MKPKSLVLCGMVGKWLRNNSRYMYMRFAIKPPTKRVVNFWKAVKLSNPKG